MTALMLLASPLLIGTLGMCGIFGIVALVNRGGGSDA